jgi:hypothetical protein
MNPWMMDGYIILRGTSSSKDNSFSICDGADDSSRGKRGKVGFYICLYIKKILYKLQYNLSTFPTFPLLDLDLLMFQ